MQEKWAKNLYIASMCYGRTVSWAATVFFRKYECIENVLRPMDTWEVSPCLPLASLFRMKAPSLCIVMNDVVHRAQIILINMDDGHVRPFGSRLFFSRCFTLLVVGSLILMWKGVDLISYLCNLDQLFGSGLLYTFRFY